MVCADLDKCKNAGPDPRRYLSPMIAPRFDEVRCLSPTGLHTMRWTEWGDPGNPRVLLCVHALTRVGRDFDRLAQVLAPHYRVVCPDVVGRGYSAWLRDPMSYGLPQYLGDMVTLLARLNARTVHFVGTSMGGLIGISLAGLEGSPVERLVINDVGPRLDPEALARIGSYFGQPVRFADLAQAIAYVRSVSAPFGLRLDQDWREITETVIRPDGSGFRLHYDPRIAEPFKAVSPEAAQSGEALLWQLYDAIRCPTLLTRGSESDLLSRATAQEMTTRGPRARLVEFPRIGHAPMFFDPDQIAVVRDFLLEA
jgi:pimeloyl-ACP methyl ester carboxylesterase